MAKGRCLCGALNYELDGLFSAMIHCHCSMCRKHHGAGFGTFVAGLIAGFRWAAGEDRLTRYQSSPHGVRSFCSVCGSAGSLDTDPGMRAQTHIFVADKAPWFDIGGPVPQFAQMPPACGIALGFDRLAMLATGASRIEQVIWAPVVDI